MANTGGWTSADLETVGRNMAWGAIRLFNESRPRATSMRTFAEKYVFEDKTVLNILRQTNNKASIMKGVNQALEDYRERRLNEPDLVYKPSGSSWRQNERREVERKNKK